MTSINDSVSQLQKAELEILDNFVDVCDKLNLRYFLLYGTALGAVRHKGFIPWDDDIDVGLFREEYDIFVCEAQRLLNKNFFLQTSQTDGEYPRNYAKIRNSETTFIEKGNNKGRFNQGIFIDVFPMDYYPDGKVARLFLNLRKDIFMAKISEAFNLEGLTESLGKRVARAIIRKCIPSVQYALRKREALFKSVKNGKFVINHEGARRLFPVEWFGEGMKVEFEGRFLRIPQEYDIYLRHIYGDYMRLPPIENQVSNHDAVIVDLNKSYQEYLR